MLPAVLGALIVLGLAAAAAWAASAGASGGPRSRAAASSPARGLTLGFSADEALTGGTPSSRSVWIARAVSVGAKMVRVDVTWSQVAPARRPRGFDPADPASHGYDFSGLDGTVEQLSRAGLRVLLNVWGAPRWAEGRHPARFTNPGAWRPSSRQLGEFATALATRYDGRYPDPVHPGQALPRVRYWQVWNEPNLAFYLSPQWTRTRHGWVAASPALYRSLLNSFYGAVKRVSRSNFVVTAGTAPYGDGPGSPRMQPLQFDRGLFCFTGSGRLRALRCPDPPHLDALSHHPYGIGGPVWHALVGGDVAVPDVYKLARVLHAAERSGRVLPRGPKRLWVTEISWDSSPPDPKGVPVAIQARWYEQAMYVLWRQGVDTILYLEIVDAPPTPSYASTYQAGLYYLDGQPKPAAQAYRFPFVTDPRGHRRLLAWGKAPASGNLSIEALSHRRWRTIRSLRVRAGQVFETVLRLSGQPQMRAQLGAQTSLTYPG
jgi:hypothetical protein